MQVRQILINREIELEGKINLINSFYQVSYKTTTNAHREAFDMHLEDLFKFFSQKTETLQNTKNSNSQIQDKSTSQHFNQNSSNSLPYITKSHFLKYLDKISLIVSDKIFCSFDYLHKGMLDFDEFAEPHRILRLGDIKEISKLMFNIFDFNSDGHVSMKDLKFLLIYFDIKNGGSSESKESQENLEKHQILEVNQDNYIDQLLIAAFNDRPYLKLNDFYDALLNDSQDLFLVVYKYLYESIPAFKSNLIIYENRIYHINSYNGLKCTSVVRKRSTTFADSYDEDFRKTSCSTTTSNTNGILSNVDSSIEIEKLHEKIKERQSEDELKHKTKHLTLQENVKFLRLSDYESADLEKLNKQERKEGLEIIRNISSYSSFQDALPLKDQTQLTQLENIINKFNTDDNNNFDELFILENTLKKSISYEGDIYFIKNPESVNKNPKSKSNSDMHGLHLTQNYIVVIGNIMYVYESNNITDKCKVYFLLGSHIKKLPRVKIDNLFYFCLKVYMQNDEAHTFYLKEEKLYSSLLNTLRSSLGYKNYFENYNIVNELGNGSYGIVYLCQQIELQKQFATKIIKKSSVKYDYWKRVKTEIEILQKADHPNIIKYIDSYENSEYHFIVMEYVKYGNLSKYVQQNKKLKEVTVSNIIYQMATTLKYLHSLGIMHRDIKPDNILLNGSREFKNTTYPLVKITDFGLAKILTPGEYSRDSCGSILFCSPESLQNKSYNTSADIWSLGMNAFFLLTCSFPFKVSKDKNEIQNIICFEGLNYYLLENRSSEALDFIQRCLERKINKRMNIEEIISHPWILRNLDSGF